MLEAFHRNEHGRSHGVGTVRHDAAAVFGNVVGVVSGEPESRAHVHAGNPCLAVDDAETHGHAVEFERVNAVLDDRRRRRLCGRRFGRLGNGLADSFAVRTSRRQGFLRDRPCRFPLPQRFDVADPIVEGARSHEAHGDESGGYAAQPVGRQAAALELFEVIRGEAFRAAR